MERSAARTHPEERFIELETLRGMAAINVFAGHFFLAFAPHTHGLLFPEQPGGMVRSPLFALFNGSSAVMFFFVLSGFVLTIKALGSRTSLPILLMAMKRWPRLALPICLVSLGSAALGVLDFYKNAQVGRLTDSSWLTVWRFSFPDKSPNFSDALLEGGFLTFLTGSASYNASLWTMYYEFVGSFLAFGLALILIHIRRRVVAVILIAMAWLGLFFASPMMSCFVIGVALSWAYCEGLIEQLALYFHKRPVQKVVSGIVAASLIGLLWGYYTPVGFYAFVGRLSPLTPLATSVAIQSVAAALLFLSALICAPYAKILTGSWGRLLGRLSFPIYLVHLPVICSLSCWLYLHLDNVADRRVSVALIFGLTSLAIAAVSLPLSYLDSRWTAFLNRVATRPFRKAAV